MLISDKTSIKSDFWRFSHKKTFGVGLQLQLGISMTKTTREEKENEARKGSVHEWYPERARTEDNDGEMRGI